MKIILLRSIRIDLLGTYQKNKIVETKSLSASAYVFNNNDTLTMINCHYESSFEKREQNNKALCNNQLLTF